MVKLLTIVSFIFFTTAQAYGSHMSSNFSLLCYGDSIVARSQDNPLPPDNVLDEFPKAGEINDAGWCPRLAELLTPQWAMSTMTDNGNTNSAAIQGPWVFNASAGGSQSGDAWGLSGGTPTDPGIYWPDIIDGSLGKQPFNTLIMEWGTNEYAANLDYQIAPASTSAQPLGTRENVETMIDYIIANPDGKAVFFRPPSIGGCVFVGTAGDICGEMWEMDETTECISTEFPYYCCTGLGTGTSCPTASPNESMPDLFVDSYPAHAQVLYTEAVYDAFLVSDASGDRWDWWYQNGEFSAGSSWIHPNSLGIAEMACILSDAINTKWPTPGYQGCGTRPPAPTVSVNSSTSTTITLDVGGVTDADGDTVRTWAWCVCNQTAASADPTCSVSGVRSLGAYDASDRTVQRTATGGNNSCINSNCIAQSGDSAGSDGDAGFEITPDWFELTDAAAGGTVVIRGLTTGTAYNCTAVAWDGFRGSLLSNSASTTTP